MLLSTKIPRGRMPVTGAPLYAILVFAAALLVTQAATAADDPYLQLLNEEASKVDGVLTDTESQQGTPEAAMAASGDAGDVPSRAAFETLLREEHVGTYTFYRRLPERSREEIFLDFSRGASMESLRGKIVDRYLHQ